MRGEIITKETDLEEIEFKNLWKFKAESWVSALICMLSFGVFYAISNVGNNFLEVRYSLSQSTAGVILSTFYLMTGLLTPLFGWVTDKIGHKLNMILLSGIILLGSCLLFLYIPPCDGCYIGLLPFNLMGLFLAMFSAAYWPMLVLLEDKKLMGLLNGMIYVIGGLGEGAFPTLVGWIQDTTNSDGTGGYYWILVFEASMSVLNLVPIILLIILNVKRKIGLNK